jgi:hypothetical protein
MANPAATALPTIVVRSPKTPKKTRDSLNKNVLGQGLLRYEEMSKKRPVPSATREISARIRKVRRMALPLSAG